MRAILALLILSFVPLAANAREGGDWSNVDPDTRTWIKSLHRPDLGDGHTSSCCGEGDAYEADTGVVSEDGQNYPTGHVIVFASEGGSVFCFIPNGGI